MEVVTIAGEPVGRIDSIWDIGPHDVYTVVRNDGSEALIPAVKEIVTDIDRDHNRITIDPPEGMLDRDSNDAV